jgi:prepilin-type N-terminal cleavage/methylation domain-containing protein
MSSPRTARAGFTLVEIMIVVAILALLAAVALPQFTSEKEEGKASAMVSSLSVLRTAIDSYWTQHDKFPGQGGALELADQLIKATNKAGSTGAGTGFGYGPYLRNGKLPINPLTGTSTVRVVTRDADRAARHRGLDLRLDHRRGPLQRDGQDRRRSDYFSF